MNHGLAFLNKKKEEALFMASYLKEEGTKGVEVDAEVNDDNIVLIVKVEASKADDNTKRKLAMDMKVGEIVKELTAVDSPLVNNYKQSSSDSLEGLLCCLIAYKRMNCIFKE